MRFRFIFLYNRKVFSLKPPPYIGANFQEAMRCNRDSMLDKQQKGLRSNSNPSVAFS